MRMRSLAVPAVLVLALTSTGCGGEDEVTEQTVAEMGVSASEAGCDDVVTEPFVTPAPDGDGLPPHHDPQDQPIDYGDAAPPATGLHWPNFLNGPQLRPFYTRRDAPAVETLLHSAEHGHTIAWYDDTVSDDSDAYAALKAIAEELPSEDYLIAAPWTAEDGPAFPAGKHFVLTHWTGPEDMQGVWQYCADVSGAVVEEFVEDYPASNSPEPGAP